MGGGDMKIKFISFEKYYWNGKKRNEAVAGMWRLSVCFCVGVGVGWYKLVRMTMTLILDTR